MMEFTCDGMVRMGYGFYNPNHAAALICALLPFLWEWFLQTRRKIWKITAILLNLLLLTALVFTFSRTGIIIVILEAFLFAALKHKIHWKWITIFAIVMLTLLCISGLWMRFRLDGAVLNRPKIWWAGLQLSAVNPLGVGSGNSGKLATTFLLPEGIQCRTLVNSHLTLLVEYGMIAGLFWFAALFYALSHGIRKTASFCALAGLAVSAASASIFDWGILFDFQDYGELPLLNFLLSWSLFLFYIGLLVCCSIGKFHRKKAAAVTGGVCLLLLLLLFLQTPETPRIKGKFIIKEGSPFTALLYDSSWNLREIRPYLQGGWVLPLNSGIPPKYSGKAAIERIYLFGEMCSLAMSVSGIPLYFICPPDYIELPDNLKGVYLSQWSDNDFLKERLRVNNISIMNLPTESGDTTICNGN